MLNFDFITDEQFRTSLQSDYRELQACLENGAWKAVHVLAGSIIEALLVEYLVSAPNQSSGKNPLNFTLDEAIKACLAARALTERSAKLSDVVKDYRNLIHPGRVIRLNEQYGQDTAQIAVSLVSFIANELASKRKLNYGLTAEQIVRKLTVDNRAFALIPGLLAETSETERRRLVNTVIWSAYTAQIADPFCSTQTLSLLRDCYRQALKSLPDDDKLVAAQRFAKMVKHESTEQLTRYADASFACEDIALLTENDKNIVKTHIFSRWESTKVGENSRFFAEVLSGLGAYLEEPELHRFVRLCLRFVLSADAASQSDFSYFAMVEYSSLPNPYLKEKFIGILEGRRQTLSSNSAIDKVKVMDDLIANCKAEIPF
jgi:hypothetical protein